MTTAAVQPLLDRVAALPGGSVSGKLIAGDGPNLGRTLVLRKAVAPGDVLVQLPLSELLCRSAAESDDILGSAFSVFREKGGANELCSLTLYLTCLRSSPDVLGGGRWSAYLAALPDDCPTPLGWEGPALSLLCQTPLAAALQQQVAVVDELYSLWWPKLMACAASVATGSVAGEALQRVHRSDILYAYSMVASRAFAVPFPNDAAPLCLIPLVDMLDHSPTVKVEYATSKGEEGKGAGGGTFSLIAKSSQPEGQPLWINYGSCKANSELLIQHGFAVPDNPSDSFSSNLRIRSPDGAAPATDLAIILRSAGLKPQQQLSLANPLPAAMLHVLALLHLPPQCAYFLAARCLEPTNTTNPSEPGTPRFPASGDTSGFPASPLHRLSRDGGLDVVVPVGSPRNNKRPTPAAPTHGRRPLSPLFSSVLLLPSFGSDDLPLPLVRAVATTLTRLLRHELERCEVAAGAEGMPSAATVSTTGSADPFEAMALFLQGQVDILRASLETAVAWEERMSSKAAFVSAAPEAVSGGPLATSDLGLWHELHLQLLKLSEVGTHHWLPLLPDMDSEEEEEPTGAATAVPSTVPFACWNRLLTAATVCGAELPLLERCGAPALLSCAAQVQAAAEAFRAGLEHLPYLTEQGLSSPDTAKHDAAKSPEVLLHELLQDELAQVERWRKEVQADYLLLAAAGKECTGGEVQEAKEELQQLTDSVTVLKSWTFRLDRITRLQKKSTLLNPRKRRRTVG